MTRGGPSGPRTGSQAPSVGKEAVPSSHNVPLARADIHDAVVPTTPEAQAAPLYQPVLGFRSASHSM